MLQRTRGPSALPLLCFHWWFPAKTVWSHNLLCLHWRFCQGKGYFQIPFHVACSVFLKVFRQLFLLEDFTSELMSESFLSSQWKRQAWLPHNFFLPSVYWEDKWKSGLSKTSSIGTFQNWFAPKPSVSPYHYISPLVLLLKLHRYTVHNEISLPCLLGTSWNRNKESTYTFFHLCGHLQTETL